MRKLLETYKRELNRRGIEAGCHEDKPISPQHIAWMIDTLLLQMEIDRSDVARFNRWLGWIQCSLVIHSFYSLSDVREHSRDMEGL